MANPAGMIDTKAKAMAKAMNDAIQKKRDAKIEELKKAAAKAKAAPAKPGGKPPPAKPGAKPGAKGAEEDFDKKLWTVEMVVASEGFKRDRKPEVQAELCAQGYSWTCASSHMVDMARHVDLYAAKPGVKSKSVMLKPETPFGSKDEHFMTYAEWQAEWNKAMKAQDLRNYVGGKTYNSKDAYHVELPNSRMLHSAKEVQSCMKSYAEYTRLGKYKPNKEFESSSSWKSDLAPFLKAAEEEVERKKEEERLEGIRQMRLDGSVKGSAKLGRAVSKSGKLAAVAIGSILPPSPIDSGAMKTKPVMFKVEATWDSLGRSFFEKIGIAPTSGFDIKVVCGVMYGAVTYANLTQSFLSDLKVFGEVIYNTPIASLCKMDVDVSASVELKKSGMYPMGPVVFDIVLKTPVQSFKAVATINISGDKASGTAKIL